MWMPLHASAPSPGKALLVTALLWRMWLALTTSSTSQRLSRMVRIHRCMTTPVTTTSSPACVCAPEQP